jgi:hypothetical protein
MKNLIKKIFVIVFVVLNIQHSNAQKTKAVERNEKTNTIKTIYPEVKFDIEETNKLLENGNSSIKGVLFTRKKNAYGIKVGPRILAADVIVNLFPVTLYLDSWYALRRQKENKRTKVEMCEEALKKCIETKTDYDGNFKFTKLKPGRYFLQSYIHSEYDYHQTVDTGQRDVNSAGDVTIYTKNVNYTDVQDECIEKFVEIKENGEIIEIKLK